MIEIYKNILGYEGLYKASNLGNIKSIKRFRSTKGGGKVLVTEKILKEASDKDGYKYVCLSKNANHKNSAVHRLILLAFEPEKINVQVNHKDGIKDNNLLSNLEWCTASQNQLHSRRVLNNKQPSGALAHRAKLTDDEVLFVRTFYHIYKSHKEISNLLGVSRKTIDNVINNKRYVI